jgi:hypothetical protein
MVKIKEAEYKDVKDLTEEQRYFYNEGRNDPKAIDIIWILLVGIMFGLAIADYLHKYLPGFFE